MDWEKVLIGDRDALLAIPATAILAYVALLALLRTTGKRTLARMDAFDLVVTVALGSTLGTTLVSPQVSWLEGVLALASLVLLQFAVAKSLRKSRALRRLVKLEPRTLVLGGQVIPAALARERIVEGDVWAAARKAGMARKEDVAAVILESDGRLSVLGRRWSDAEAPQHGSILPGDTAGGT